jgi:imidazolonepropionase-like amidohydrolase
MDASPGATSLNPRPAWRATASRSQVRDAHVKSFGRAVHAGVKIAMGTDAGTPYNVHGENLNELALMVEAGMTPMQAIVASTRMGADLLQLGDKVGTLEPGKLADIVLVEGNPAEQIDLLQDQSKIVLVMKDDVVVKGGQRS